MPVSIDTSEPILIDLDFQSPQAVTYRMWSKKPDDAAWSIFATGDDTKPQQTVGPLPSGSQLAYHFLFLGNPNTSYRLVLTLSQKGETLADSEIIIRGTTDDKGVRARQAEQDLV